MFVVTFVMVKSTREREGLLCTCQTLIVNHQLLACDSSRYFVMLEWSYA